DATGYSTWRRTEEGAQVREHVTQQINGLEPSFGSFQINFSPEIHRRESVHEHGAGFLSFRDDPANVVHCPDLRPPFDHDVLRIKLSERRPQNVLGRRSSGVRNNQDLSFHETKSPASIKCTARIHPFNHDSLPL